MKEGLERERSTYSLSVQSLSQRVRELEREKARREGAEERVKVRGGGGGRRSGGKKRRGEEAGERGEGVVEAGERGEG